MFSRRIPPDLAPNALSRLRAGLGRIPFDLTVSNPTIVGIPYPPALLRPLGDRRCLAYRPEPAGLALAREAVARELKHGGRAVSAGSLVLTASTSEAYSLLFKLLCDPGEAVLVPAPSYPLFDHLARLEGIRPVSYPLDPRSAWQPSFEEPPDPGTRAVVVVNPNNPTGSFVEPGGPASFCARHELAVIADEVFFDYPLEPGLEPASFAGNQGTLTFTLGGVSKYLGLPQLKLAWIAVSGPRAATAGALERLEFIADQYLSVATPVQLALEELFAGAAGVRKAILARCRSNLETARRAIGSGGAIELITPAAGFSLVLRHPNVIEEEQLALELLERDGVAVHPGYFFDFADQGYLAISLLPEPETFAGGLARVLARIASRL